MCGILVSVHRVSEHSETWPSEDTWEDLRAADGARGPDNKSEHTVEVDGENGRIALRFFSSVLHLRGDHVVKQPFVSEQGDVFCWNGEVFEGLEIKDWENDGELLFRALCEPSTHDPREVLARIEGPYAFVYFHKARRRLYFGRDPIGRRSLLLYNDPSDSRFLLSSVSAGHKEFNFEEVSPASIHCLDLDGFVSGRTQGSLSLLSRAVRGAVDTFLQAMDVNTELPPPLTSPTGRNLEARLSATVDAFISHLEESVRLRVRNIPRIPSQNERDSRVGILFSGGVDCTLLALLAHRCLPLAEAIDLLNVAFENPRKLGIESGKRSRVREPTMNSTSGALDVAEGAGESERSKYGVPDRTTGMDAVAELEQICTGRRWNFVTVDVSYDECMREQATVQHLMSPSNTVMDLSLANALYFASRGTGCCHLLDGTVDYNSPARVLLSGLGADEQLGGYSRHRRAYTKGQWPGLVEELQLDITRLPSRNLGRDDRVISSWGKETRYPYLSLSFIAFVSGLPVHLKVDPSLPGGTGDKMLLRLAAKKLGLERASQRKKRAMQFGSRSARMQGGDLDKKGHVLLS